jgi:hypothetical protein
MSKMKENIIAAMTGHLNGRASAVTPDILAKLLLS